MGDTVNDLLAVAEAQLERRAYRAAHAACIEVLTRDPSQPDAYRLLGILTADHQNHVKAVELFDRSLAAAPGDPRTRAAKARSLIALNRKEDAVAAIEGISASAPRDALTLDTMGVVYSRAGRHEEAIPFYERAAEKAPSNANIRYNLGAARQFAGHLDEAVEAYRAAFDLDPDDVRSLTAAVHLTRQTAEKNDRQTLEALFARFDHDADVALHLGHALAKLHEDLGQPARALDWLARGKALKARSLDYDPVTDRQLFAASAATAALHQDDGAREPAPIFVVGMPRTGTTLIDRILSSHSAVASAGELTDFGLHLKRLAGTTSRHVLDTDTLARAADIDAAALGRAYISGVRSSLGLEGRFIDKMPLNILYAPLILRSLPNARIICLRRHPADTVLSNYRQLFATGFSYYNYAYDLAHTAQYYAGFDRLVRHFAETLPPDRFTEVRYEAVVEDIEAEARRLLEFCGLSFERSCIEFHQNTAPVATASSAQVRKPLYTTSVGRWKRYRPGIDPALEVLVDEGCLPPSDLSD